MTHGTFADCKRFHDRLLRNPEMHRELLALGIGLLLGQKMAGAAAAAMLAWERAYPDVPLPDIAQAILRGENPEFTILDLPDDGGPLQ
jgi:hypothetical protein